VLLVQVQPLEYKSLAAGSGITITYSTGSITIDTTGSSMISGSGTTGTNSFISRR